MNIVIIAGELSGDLLGAKLCEQLLLQDSSLSISGIGGQAMRDAGVNTLHDVSETAVLGIFEILRHYPRLHRILTNLKKHLKNSRPELLVLIDYPEFNLKLAAYAKTLGIKVMFYVSPQIWAWRTGRVKTIKQRVDLMAVLFPFELDFYQKANVDACLVRHPLLEEVDKLYQANTHDTLTIGIAPGSRKNEIKKLFPVMLKAAQLLHRQNPSFKFLVPIASGFDKAMFAIPENVDLPISFESGNFYTSIAKCDAVMIAAGTATLQTGLMGKAMVIAYKISPITYKLFGHLVKVDHISLVNIILNKRIFTELLQKDASPENLYREIAELMNDENRNIKMNEIRSELYKKLDNGCSSKELAIKALSLAASH